MMETQAQATELVTGIGEDLLGHPSELRPPYRGTFERVVGSEQLFWWHLVKKPRVGEVVVQVGARSTSHPPSGARAVGGLRHVYRATATGPHDFKIAVQPGPITRKGTVLVSAQAWVQGLSGTLRSTPVYSWRRTFLEIRDVFLRYGQTYTIVVAGDVLVAALLGSQPYGEFIATFPLITVTPPYYAASEQDQEELSRFDEAIGGHSTLEEMCKACSSEPFEGHAETQALSEEEALESDSEGFVTSTRDSD